MRGEFDETRFVSRPVDDRGDRDARRRRQTASADRAKVGTLRCNLTPSVGLLIVKRQRLSCTYTPDGPFPPETYFGHFTTVGAAIGFSSGGRMVWAVFAPVSNHYRGALAGTYVGASAGAAVGAGLGANALVGGSHRSIALQPLSIQASTGLDLTAGVSKLRLHFAP